MIGQNFARQRPGQPIKARTLNRPAREIERLSRLRVNSGLAQVGDASIPLIYSTTLRPITVRLVHSYGAGKYSWQAIFGLSGGGHGDLTGVSGTDTIDPAWEQNGNANLAVGTIVELEREPYTGEWRFQLDRCQDFPP